MSDQEDLNKAIEVSVGKVSLAVAKETHHPQDRLSSPELRAKQIEQELRLQIKDFRKKCVEGMHCCSQALEQDAIQDLKQAFHQVKDLLQLSESLAKGARCCELLGIKESTMHSLYHAAKALFDQKRHEEAEAAFTFLILLDHGQYAYWLGLGHARAQTKQFVLAIEAYRRAQELEPTLCWPPIFIANCLIERNDFVGAFNELEEAIKLYREDKNRDRDMELALVERLTFIKNRGTL